MVWKVQSSVTSLPLATLCSGELWVTWLHSTPLSVKRKNKETVRGYVLQVLGPAQAHPGELNGQRQGKDTERKIKGRK